jgi:hypothetical protein
MQKTHSSCSISRISDVPRSLGHYEAQILGCLHSLALSERGRVLPQLLAEKASFALATLTTLLATFNFSSTTTSQPHYRPHHQEHQMPPTTASTTILSLSQPRWDIQNDLHLHQPRCCHRGIPSTLRLSQESH